ncbi:hypothetical protein CYMTET_34730 [Cymbomonas tetramitiformis]|uniref:Uncharacterized protein n=1 Tax=Cymbomonas tetramitiformis TaxID=36881 RepID=A0AAE0FAK4_9CHLO|nr:hypothetical protein CYMTET_34730 [Cymbomonas tetramitiformis]
MARVSCARSEAVGSGAAWHEARDAGIMGDDWRMQKSEAAPGLHCLHFIKEVAFTEAEMTAMFERAREVRCVMNVVNHMVTVNLPVPMYCDSQGAIHLALDYADMVQICTLEALYPGDNTADIFTPLPGA